MHQRTAQYPLLAVLAAIAFAVVTGCPAGERSALSAVRRDSAGITIVESSRAVWDSAEAWTIDATPMRRIGSADGEPPYLFSRVVGATRLPDGRIVVADGGSSQLRFFDSAGVFVQAVGRAGEGPGEFQYMRRMARCGADSLFAFDLHWEAKVFAADGKLAREVATHEPGSTRGPYALACSPTGVFAVSGWGTALGTRPPIGFYRSMSKVWILDGEGREVADLGEHVASERIGTPNGSGPHPFGRHTSIAVGDSVVYLGSGERFEIRRYSRDGKLERLYRAPPEDLSIPREYIEAYRAASLAEASPQRRPALERSLAEMPMPEALPAFTALHVDAEKHLWALRFRPAADSAERWGVFSPEGEFLGHVQLPPGLALHEIGPGYILGIAKDADGVEQIRLHAVRRRRPD